jgi:hypothetical protein
MDLEDVSTWLRHRVLRLRAILAKDARAESGLRELIADCGSRGTPRTVGREARHESGKDRQPEMNACAAYDWHGKSLLTGLLFFQPAF